MKLILSFLTFACLAGLISAWSVDFQYRKTASAHGTSKFNDSSKALVVRRLEDFFITIKFGIGEGFKDVNVHKVNCFEDKEQLVTLNDAEVAKVTQIKVTYFTATALLTVQFLGVAEVGKYQMDINIKKNDGEIAVESTVIYVLFNPWAREEPVYLAKASEINEYVQSDSAVMYFGTPNPRKWVFGQYEAGVLDIVCKVLSRATAKPKNDTVTIVRAVSAIANNHTKGGIVEGRWTRDFSGGTNPLDWSSSVQILKQYNRTNQPVKYGQCYVFVGVVTTILRALGIPTRTITTDFSGIDRTRTVVLDKCIDENGNVYKDGKFCGVDGRWNYHIWNEVWLRRDDLKSKSRYHSHYGWQVVDGTPAVINDGQYKIGPAPVPAVKWGQTNITYETDFVFAEVMAPVVAWLVDSKTGQRKKVLSVDYSTTGERIVTKAVGSNDQVDMYTAYKFREPHFRRIALVNALKNHGTNPKIIDHDPWKKASVVFKLKVNSSYKMGENLVVKLVSTSVSKSVEKVRVKLVAESITPIEDTWKQINSSNVDVTLNPGQKHESVWILPAKMYADKLYDGNGLAFNVLAYVEGKDQVWGKRALATITTPTLNVNNLIVNELAGSFTVDVTFDNPLPVDLHNCRMSLSGMNGIEKTEVGTVPAHGHVKFNIVNSPEKSLITAILNCDEINGMSATLPPQSFQ